MKRQKARICSEGQHAVWVGEGGGPDVKREEGGKEERQKGAFCPGPSATAHTGRTHYFSVLFLLKNFFFVCFVLFF